MTSCYNLTSDIAMKIHNGMTYNEVQKLFDCHKLKVDDINNETFTVWENYWSESGSKTTMYMIFTRKDSILVDIY